MSVDSNQEIVLQFYRAFDERNFERALSLLAEDFTAHMAGLPELLNKEEFTKFGSQFFSAFTDGKHVFEEIIVEENKIATCGKFIATHLGNFQGIPPTGKQIEISVMHIDRLDQGKIIEHWGQGDVRGLMQQLGIILIPSPKLILKMVQSFFIKQ